MVDNEVENTIDNTSTDDPLVQSEWCNKLTLELLLNKNHYDKYLSKNDPKKYDEYREYKAKLNKYEMEIIDITGQLLENPEKGFSKQIEETFEPYMKSIIKYLEVKALENPEGHIYGHENDDDSDTMFAKVDEIVTPTKKTRNVRLNHFDMSIFKK
jgi:hypothetical protein